MTRTARAKSRNLDLFPAGPRQRWSAIERGLLTDAQRRTAVQALDDEVAPGASRRIILDREAIVLSPGGWPIILLRSPIGQEGRVIYVVTGEFALGPGLSTDTFEQALSTPSALLSVDAIVHVGGEGQFDVQAVGEAPAPYQPDSYAKTKVLDLLASSNWLFDWVEERTESLHYSSAFVVYTDSVPKVLAILDKYTTRERRVLAEDEPSKDGRAVTRITLVSNQHDRSLYSGAANRDRHAGTEMKDQGYMARWY